jgi:hypothetical protein
MAEVERRFIREYMDHIYPPGTYELNVEIGEIPQEILEIHGLRGARLLYRPFRRRIDAVAWTPSSYHLIEAKIRDPLEGLGRLHTYLTLAGRTPDLPGYEHQPFKKILVVPFALEWIKQAASDDNVALVEYWQDWIADYIRDRQLYFTKEYRTTREEKLRLRQLLGVE